MAVKQPLNQPLPPSARLRLRRLVEIDRGDRLTAPRPLPRRRQPVRPHGARVGQRGLAPEHGRFSAPAIAPRSAGQAPRTDAISSRCARSRSLTVNSSAFSSISVSLVAMS